MVRMSRTINFMFYPDHLCLCIRVVRPDQVWRHKWSPGPSSCHKWYPGQFMLWQSTCHIYSTFCRWAACLVLPRLRFLLRDWVTSVFAARWERPIVWWWDGLGLRLAFPLQFFRLQCCVCVAVELAKRRMVPLCQLMLLINPFLLSLVYSILYVLCLWVFCGVSLPLFPIENN